MKQESKNGYKKFTLTPPETERFQKTFKSPNMITVFGRINPQNGATTLELASDKAIGTFKKLTRKAGIKISEKVVSPSFF